MLTEIDGIITNVNIIIENTGNDQVAKTLTAVKEDLTKLREKYAADVITHNTSVDVAVHNTEVIGENLQALAITRDLSKDLAEVSMIIATLKIN